MEEGTHTNTRELNGLNMGPVEEASYQTRIPSYRPTNKKKLGRAIERKLLQS